jgi:hypothetical protein
MPSIFHDVFPSWTCLGADESTHSSFSDYVSGFLVAADANEARMTQAILRRPR